MARGRSGPWHRLTSQVEEDNRRARSLYRALGYRQCAVDRECERPQAGRYSVSFVPTTQVVMRKDVRYPPADVLVLRAAQLAGAAWAATTAPQYEGELRALAAEAADGRLADAATHAAQLGQELAQAAAADLLGLLDAVPGSLAGLQ